MNHSKPNFALIQIPNLDTGLDIDENVKKYDDLWINIYDKVSIKGSLILFGNNVFHNGHLIPWPLLLGEHISNITGFKIKNIFSVMKEIGGPNDKPLKINHYYILLLVRSLDEYYFNKDSIREEHIFQDIEWGGRRDKGGSAYHERQVRRYSLNGRDPGNVFYKTTRDEEGSILDYIEYEFIELYKKLIMLLSEEKSYIFTNINDVDLQKIIFQLNRQLVTVEF